MLGETHQQHLVVRPRAEGTKVRSWLALEQEEVDVAWVCRAVTQYVTPPAVLRHPEGVIANVVATYQYGRITQRMFCHGRTAMGSMGARPSQPISQPHASPDEREPGE